MLQWTYWSLLALIHWSGTEDQKCEFILHTILNKIVWWKIMEILKRPHLDCFCLWSVPGNRASSHESLWHVTMLAQGCILHMVQKIPGLPWTCFERKAQLLLRRTLLKIIHQDFRILSLCENNRYTPGSNRIRSGRVKIWGPIKIWPSVYPQRWWRAISGEERKKEELNSLLTMASYACLCHHGWRTQRSINNSFHEVVVCPP